MSGFGPLGCDPEATGAALSDIGGVTLGTVAYSPNGQYIAVQAGGAITQYALCRLDPGFQITEAAAADAAGANYCIPQVAVTDDHYAWALVQGRGTVKVSGAATTAEGGAAIGGGGLAAAYNATDTILGLNLDTNTSTTARNEGCFAMWPVKST